MKRWIQHAMFGMVLGGCVQQDAPQAPAVDTAEASTCPGPGNYKKVAALVTTAFDGTFAAPQSASQHLLTIPDPRTKGGSIAALIDLDKGVVIQAVTFDAADLYKVHASVPDQPWTDHFHNPPPPPPPIGDKWLTAALLEVGLADHAADTIGYANVVVAQ